MYFPRDIEEISDFFRFLKNRSINEKLYIIDDALRAMTDNRAEVDPAAVSLLQNYKMTLLEQERRGYDSNVMTELMYKNECLEREVGHLLDQLHQQERHFQLIMADKKSYKNLYIFILSHPNNNSTAITEILSRVNYLDKMTRDVIFVMPGYKRAGENDSVVKECDSSLQLTFDENVFINIVQQIEDESDGKFLYDDRCELLIVGSKNNGQYDFSSFVRLDLNHLAKNRGIDPVRLIINVAQRFRTDDGKDIEIKKYVNQILGELTMTEERPTVRVFIAGAKKLTSERALLREELSKVENTLNLDIRALTFEDFATSLTGESGGRQKHYNEFIRNSANVVVFIFDSTLGEITEEEFDVAYESLKQNKHPEIFVYSKKKHNFISRAFSPDKLAAIREKVFGHHQEYYVEYRDDAELRYLFYSNMVAYFQPKKD